MLKMLTKSLRLPRGRSRGSLMKNFSSCVAFFPFTKGRRSKLISTKDNIRFHFAKEPKEGWQRETMKPRRLFVRRKGGAAGLVLTHNEKVYFHFSLSNLIFVSLFINEQSSKTGFAKLEQTKAKGEAQSVSIIVFLIVSTGKSSAINYCLLSLNWRVPFIVCLTVSRGLPPDGMSDEWRESDERRSTSEMIHAEIFHWQINACHFTLAQCATCRCLAASASARHFSVEIRVGMCVSNVTIAG